MLRYQEDNELHRDFHGTANATFDSIAEKYGAAALGEILRSTGRNVYRSIRERLGRGDASERIVHLIWFYSRESAPFRLDVSKKEIRFEVFECPVRKHLEKRGFPVSKHTCMQTSELNAGMCRGIPWTSSVEFVSPGHCVQR